MPPLLNDPGEIPTRPVSKQSIGQPAHSAINIKSPRIMDFRPSQGLATGMKRIGGRNSSVSRLGALIKRGRPINQHKY